MDIKSPEERSKNMAAIHSKNTKPEIYLRKLMFARGYRYSVNSKNIIQRFLYMGVSGTDMKDVNMLTCQNQG